GHRDVAERVAARPDRSDDGAGALPHLDLHTAGRFASREPDEAGGGTEAVSAGRDEVAAGGGEALDAPLAHVAGGGGAGGEGDRAVGDGDVDPAHGAVGSEVDTGDRAVARFEVGVENDGAAVLGHLDAI